MHNAYYASAGPAMGPDGQQKRQRLDLSGCGALQVWGRTHLQPCSGIAPSMTSSATPRTVAPPGPKLLIPPPHRNIPVAPSGDSQAFQGPPQPGLTQGSQSRAAFLLSCCLHLRTGSSGWPALLLATASASLSQAVRQCASFPIPSILASHSRVPCPLQVTANGSGMRRLPTLMVARAPGSGPRRPSRPPTRLPAPPSSSTGGGPHTLVGHWLNQDHPTAVSVCGLEGFWVRRRLYQHVVNML